MKYSMMTYTLSCQAPDRKCDMPAVCRLTRQLGLDAIDQVSLYGYDPKDLRKMADDESLRYVCYTFGVDLSHPDRKSLAPALDAVQQGLEVARILGAPKIMIPIGRKTEYSRAEQRKLTMAGLAEAVRLGREYGVKITTEHFVCQAPFIATSDMQEMLAAVPGMYVTFDAGCVLAAGENPIDGYQAIRDKVIHAHFKDYIFADTGMEGLDGKFYQPALIGEGSIDYAALIRTMNAAGYDGYVNIEYEGKKYSAEQAIRKALAYLRNLEGN